MPSTMRISSALGIGPRPLRYSIDIQLSESGVGSRGLEVVVRESAFDCHPTYNLRPRTSNLRLTSLQTKKPPRKAASSSCEPGRSALPDISFSGRCGHLRIGIQDRENR